MKETNYAFAVAYTRTLENKMLTMTDMDVMLNADSEHTARKYLLDKGYGHTKAQLGEEVSTQDMLSGELSYAWVEVREACPEGAPIDVLLYQNDFHNLKTILKAVFTKSDWKNILLTPCTIDPDEIYAQVSTGQMENLPPLLKQPAIEAHEVLAKTQDGQLAEVLLDKAAYAAVLQAANENKSKFLLDWVDLNAAIIDMKIALRGASSERTRAFLASAMLPCRQLDTDRLLDAAEQGAVAVTTALADNGFEQLSEAAKKSVGEFEKCCDNILMNYLKDSRNKAFGFEPILGFLIGKQTELQAVRIILSGLEHKIAPNILKERLRELYV